MNRQKTMIIVMVFSLAFNVSFLSMWGYHVLYVRPALEAQQAQVAQPSEPALPAQWEALRLGTDQRRQMLAQYAGLRSDIGPVLSDAKSSRDELLLLISSPKADPQQLQDAERKMAEHQEKIRRLVMERLMRMRGVLDEEQRLEFGKMLRYGPGGEGMQKRPFVQGHNRPMRPPQRKPQGEEKPAPEKDTL